MMMFAVQQLSKGEPGRSGARLPSPIHIRLSLDKDHRWRVASDAFGLSKTGFADLPQAIAFAKEVAAEEAAIVELQIDGFSAVIHQERGWPKPIC
jgi:hypothetical protein